MRVWVEPTLGRLARWLRLMGVDAPSAHSAPPRLPPGEAFLTRTRRLAGRPGFVLVLPDRPDEQLAQVAAELGLTLKPELLFSRCLDCNLPVEPISREQAAGSVPVYTLHRASGFTRCPGCGRVFWPGSHGPRARAMLERALAKAPAGADFPG